jgi:hypothetical protein
MVALSRSRMAALLGLALLLSLLPAGGLASDPDAEITVNDAEIVVVRQADALLHFEDPVPLYPGYPIPSDNTTAAWDDLDVGDLNGDGDDEIVVIHTASARLKVYDPEVQSGSDPMTLDRTYSVGRTRIITADTDGDGERELAVIRDFNEEDLCSVAILSQYTGDGLDEQVCITIWHDLAAADLNGDGDHELFLAKRDSDEPDDTGKLKVWDVVVQSGQTEVKFQESPSLFWWRDVAAGDVDGDGKDEVILIRDYDKRLVVRKWNGSGMPVIYENFFTEPWEHVTSGDIDGDGEDELVLVKSDLVNYIHVNGTQAQLVEGARPQAGAWTQVATGDLNDDGDDEVVLLTSEGRIVVDDPVVQTGSSPVAFDESYAAAWDLIGVGTFDGPVTFEPAAVLVEPSEVSIDAEVGEVHTVDLSVTSPGDDDPVNWTASLSNEPTWVDVSPLSGTTPSTVTLEADCTGVTKGTYEMSITFDEAGGGGVAPLEVPVTIDVSAPTLSVTPERMRLFHALGDPDPPPKYVSVTQRGGEGQGIQWKGYVLPPTQAAQWQALPEAQQVEMLENASIAEVSWLHITPISGTTPSIITTTFTLSGLDLGAHNATILVDGGSGTKDRLQYVEVRLTIASEVYRTYMPLIWRGQ